MKKAIFTVIIGGYDELIPAPSFDGWDCFLFTDTNPVDSKGWTVRIVPRGADPQKESRRYKIKSHEYLPEYELVCYIDGNVKLLQEPPSHPVRGVIPSVRGIYHMADKIIDAMKADPPVISRQMSFYKMSHLRGDSPIYFNGFFVRRQDYETNGIHELWWNHIDMFASADQIPLSAILEVRDTDLEGSTRAYLLEKYFTVWSPHLGSSEYKQKPSVHHITPARGDKNIGRAINELVAKVDDNDWICLRDIDTVPPLHKQFIRQCEDIAMSGQYDLVGCITNRCGLERQLYKKHLSDNMDMMYHIKVAEELFVRHGSDVTDYTGTIAGVMMLFSKKLWLAIGGIDEGAIVNKHNEFFDYTFSKKAMAVKARIGIADGVYLFHLYRPKSSTPTTDILHLY